MKKKKRQNNQEVYHKETTLPKLTFEQKLGEVVKFTSVFLFLMLVCYAIGPFVR